MEKIKNIKQEQFEELKSSNDMVACFKKIINIKEIGRYCVGDTTIKVDNSKKLEVYRETFNNKNFYYIIVNPIDEKIAFAYSLYPRN